MNLIHILTKYINVTVPIQLSIQFKNKTKPLEKYEKYLIFVILIKIFTQYSHNNFINIYINYISITRGITYSNYQ